ncbi:MAG: diguanylate cyclase [Planctomycetota bacterium]
MMLVRSLRLAFLLFPLVCLSLALLTAMGETILPMDQYALLVFAIALAVAVICGGGLLALDRLTRLDRRLREMEDHQRFLESNTKSLRYQVELLSAMREVSRVVSDDVQFDKILDKVMRIVEELLGTEEIVIFAVDESSEGLVPRALRRDRQSVFEEEALAALPPDPQVQAAMTYRQLFMESEGGSTGAGSFKLVLPLIADQEIFGVMKIRTGVVTPNVSTELLEYAVKDIAKHITLALKTPALHSRAVLDSLTGLYTKRHFAQQLSGFYQRCQNGETTFSLVLLDIDHFKLINDRHGHLSGDRVLADISENLKACIRDGDSAYRYGGEELAILLPGSSIPIATQIAERIRKRVASKAFRTADGREITVTVSLGVAELTKAMPNPDALVAAADAALYKAKENGRNLVCTG